MRWSLLAVMLGLGVWAGWSARRGPRPPQPRVLDTAAAQRAARCGDCHQDIVDSLAAAPHRLTLRRADDPQLQARFAGREIELLEKRYRFSREGRELYFEYLGPTGSEDAAAPSRLRVDWVFGSGQHALTPVALAETATGQSTLIQLAATWYADDSLGLTPGLDGLDQQPTLFGGYHTHRQALDCFGCHSTSLPLQDGVLAMDDAEVGVSCGRCHLRTEAHVAADGESPTAPAWTELSPLESINRCGECHRRADEFTPDELSETNPLLVRFAPVGLSLSKCFQEAGGRLDCLTCHDPHEPAASDPETYRRRCLDCHATPQSGCSSQPLESNCLQCHMPAVDVSDHLRFTDHWIRVRRPAAAGDR